MTMNAPIWLGGVVLLVWALLARTASAQGAQARIGVASDYTGAGVDVACGEFDHRYSWPVSRHIYIYKRAYSRRPQWDRLVRDHPRGQSRIRRRDCPRRECGRR